MAFETARSLRLDHALLEIVLHVCELDHFVLEHLTDGPAGHHGRNILLIDFLLRTERPF